MKRAVSASSSSSSSSESSVLDPGGIGIGGSISVADNFSRLARS